MVGMGMGCFIFRASHPLKQKTKGRTRPFEIMMIWGNYGLVDLRVNTTAAAIPPAAAAAATMIPAWAEPLNPLPAAPLPVAAPPPVPPAGAADVVAAPGLMTVAGA